MLLAEAEAFYSRPIAPTRRVALGDLQLPVDPAPGYGGILLGGIAAGFGPLLDEDFHEEALALMTDLERGARVSQPRLRHRLQEDRVGLQRCTHRLLGDEDGSVHFELQDDKGTPAQHLLTAIYAAGAAPRPVRRQVMDAVRKGFRWTTGPGPALVAHLSGRSAGLSASALRDPVSWAMGVLDLRTGGFTDGSDGTALMPSRRDIQRAFRDALRTAHPDHGGRDDGAAQRISELTEARRILLG
ncbi:MAG: hypothetical protein ACOYOP_00615 [Microthrixaceae bacterium]